MKKLFFLALFLCVSFVSFSQTNSQVKYQQDYYKPSTGSYVEGHYKTKTNNTNVDNYSTTGNVNPYTNAAGSKAIDYSTQANNYGSDKTIYTGSQGGQYYINSNGNKTFVPKRN